MKKKNFISILTIFLLFLVACNTTIPTYINNSSQNLSEEGVESKDQKDSSLVSCISDKTVNVDKQFEMNGYQVIGETRNAADTEIYHNVAEVYENSSYIVYGNVEEIGYWDESGTGFTLCNFVVEKSYKGELMPGDKISVLAAGGYYRLSKYIELNGKDRFPDLTDEEIQTSVYKTAYMGAPLVEKGEKYLLFLDQILDEPPFPDGVYTETGAFMGRFYYKDAETLMRYTPENEPDFYQDPETRSIAKQEFTLTELEAEIAACAE